MANSPLVAIGDRVAQPGSELSDLNNKGFI
jgi:hypothetical protein